MMLHKLASPEVGCGRSAEVALVSVVIVDTPSLELSRTSPGVNGQYAQCWMMRSEYSMVYDAMMIIQS